MKRAMSKGDISTGSCNERVSFGKDAQHRAATTVFSACSLGRISVREVGKNNEKKKKKQRDQKKRPRGTKRDGIGIGGERERKVVPVVCAGRKLRLKQRCDRSLSLVTVVVRNTVGPGTGVTGIQFSMRFCGVHA